MEKVYANMSACHIKRDNWKRAQETAEKALAKNPKNYKAMFRRAKALGEQGYSERAEKILEELIRQSPSGKLFLSRVPRQFSFDAQCATSDAPAATTELRRLRAIDKERQKVHNQKLKGMLCVIPIAYGHRSKAWTGWLNRGGLETPATEVAPAEVEEISSPGTKETRSSEAT
jgi:tetratricopeptide (TPR) repeat protein